MILTIKLTSHEAQIFNYTLEKFGVLLHDNNLYSTDGNMMIAVPTKYDGPKVSINWPKERKIGKAKKHALELIIDTEEKEIAVMSKYWGEVKVECNWDEQSKFPPIDSIYNTVSSNEDKMSEFINSPQYGMDIGVLKKITSVIGEQIIFSSFANLLDPIAVTPFTYNNSNLTVRFDPNKHRPSIIMPMRIN